MEYKCRFLKRCFRFNAANARNYAAFPRWRPYNDPKQAIECAGRYMRWLLDRYDSNLEKAVPAERVNKLNGVPLIIESRVCLACLKVTVKSENESNPPRRMPTVRFPGDPFLP